MLTDLPIKLLLQSDLKMDLLEEAPIYFSNIFFLSLVWPLFDLFMVTFQGQTFFERLSKTVWPWNTTPTRSGQGQPIPKNKHFVLFLWPLPTNLKPPIQDLGTFHWVSQIHGWDVPSIKYNIIRINHWHNTMEWDVDIWSTFICAETHCAGLCDWTKPVGMLKYKW